MDPYGEENDPDEVTDELGIEREETEPETEW
jgi:hypothetical protein